MSSQLEQKLKSYKTEPQSKEKALANIEKLKAEIGMKDVKSDKEDVKEILKRAGSLSDEIVDLRKKERE
jgi:hypothetical protein